MKTRIRTHSFPGDVSRDEKIAMWEKNHEGLPPKVLQRRRKLILSRERAIMKERLKKDLEEDEATDDETI
jgi:hypothetical protein